MAAPFEGAPAPTDWPTGTAPGFRIITAHERLADARRLGSCWA